MNAMDEIAGNGGWELSLADGWAAMNLQMPSRVPRTEYSAEMHWELLSAVLGREVSGASSPEDKSVAIREFVKKWNYDLIWAVAITGGEFGELKTHMGHAEYAVGGADRDDRISSPFQTPEQVLAFDPWVALGERDKGRIIQMYEDQYAAMCAAYPDCVNMSGIYITIISGLIDLFGWDNLLLAAGSDPAGFGEVANRYASWIQQYFNALAEADLPVVMIHDDIVWTEGAFLHPEWYRKFVFANYKRLFAPVIESGKKLLYTSDGNYTEFIDDIAECGVNGFVMEPTTDMAYIADKYGKTHVFIGNADTRVLMYGSREDIRAEVERCMAIGKHCPGFFMAVGNHIPPNTPVDSVLYYNEVYEELSKR